MNGKLPLATLALALLVVMLMGGCTAAGGLAPNCVVWCVAVHETAGAGGQLGAVSIESERRVRR